MPNPITYASAKQFVGMARETTQGTPVAPAVTMPVDKFEPEDKPTWIDDKALRGAMAEIFNKVQGPLHTEFDISGPLFFDTIGYLLNNILGDDVEAGTYTGSGTTTLAGGGSAAGATSITLAATIALSTKVQIDTGPLSEVRTLASGTNPYTLDSPLTYAHANGVAVKPITTPYFHTFSLLNSGAAQPGSLTFTDFQGVPASTGARTYAGGCLSELTLKGNAESTAIEYEGKGMAWPSGIAGAQPTLSPSNLQPMAAWRSQIGLAGTVGGAQIKTVGEWEIAIKRELEVIFTGQNSQNPYLIQRGKVGVTGKLVFTAVADETPLTYLLQNTQPQFQLIASNGLAGASLQAIQFDLQQAAWTTSKIDRSKAAVGYQTEYESIANTTNAGGSGGFSPISVLLSNAVTPNSY
jgi:hypothetical protein